jgi:hypothetical protein
VPIINKSTSLVVVPLKVQFLAVESLSQLAFLTECFHFKLLSSLIGITAHYH